MTVDTPDAIVAASGRPNRATWNTTNGGETADASNGDGYDSDGSCFAPP